MLSVRKDVLVKKRTEKNLSQHKLSVISGLSGNAIFRMEKYDHKVNKFHAKAVADALGCSINELFIRERVASGR